MQNFVVETAQGGFHCIHLVEKQSFDLLIIQGDELEDMPAEEVSALVRNIHSRDELPILAILLEEDDDEATSLAQSGVNDIVINTGNFNLILKEIEKIQKRTPKKK
ncbi:MAG: DNA-binding response OmpR family regulator [Bacteriovoracaceae bacterium]|jgi:DNA-binding response OmpR family regulator